MDTDTQTELAKELAEDLAANYSFDGTYIEVLDCLAIHGFMLVKMTDENVASQAYFAALDKK